MKYVNSSFQYTAKNLDGIKTVPKYSTGVMKIKYTPSKHGGLVMINIPIDSSKEQMHEIILSANNNIERAEVLLKSLLVTLSVQDKSHNFSVEDIIITIELVSDLLKES